MGETELSKSNGVITTGQEPRRSRIGSARGAIGRFARRHRFLLAGLLVLVLVAGGYGVYRFVTRVPQPAHANVEAFGGDYTLMNKAETDYYLYSKTGLTTSYLEKHDVTPKLLKTYDVAYESAKALGSVQQPQKSLQAFAVAESRLPKAGMYADFYQQYASEALAANNMPLRKQQMEKKLAAYQSDNSLAPDVKAEKIHNVKRQIQLIEEEQS